MYKKPIIKTKLTDHQQAMLNLSRVMGKDISLRQAAKDFYDLRYPTGIQNHICTQMRKKASHNRANSIYGGNLKLDFFLHCIGSTDFVVETWNCTHVKKQITKWDGSSTFIPTGEYEEYYNLYLEGYWLDEVPNIKEYKCEGWVHKKKRCCDCNHASSFRCDIYQKVNKAYCNQQAIFTNKDHYSAKYRKRFIAKWMSHDYSKTSIKHAGLHPKWLTEDGNQMSVEQRKAKYVDWISTNDWPNPKLLSHNLQIIDNGKKVIIPEQLWNTSKYRTKEWEETVVITTWEHDYENKLYTIQYKNNVVANHPSV